MIATIKTLANFILNLLTLLDGSVKNGWNNTAAIKIKMKE
jgi:hypothetical protein